MDIANYDTFFVDLEARLKRSPSDRKQIISKAVKETHCPYLLSRLQDLQRIYRITIFIFAFCLIQQVMAQTGYVVQDVETGESIIGATVQLQQGKDSKMFITDGDGRFIVSHKPPYTLMIKHIGYRTLIDTISSDVPETFYLHQTSQNLDEVIISSAPDHNVSIDRELFDVKEIDRKTIDQLAGNNLSDVLNFNMNMTIVPDVATGRSTVNMFGLSGEYVKILVDNVPMAGDNGSGNNIDISQINLENVERIEVSEGTMGVQYGSNAVAGVINIVTKKNLDHKWEVSTSVQEETVGPEYAWFGKGRHIQNVKASVNISERSFVTLGVSRNDFTGFFNDYQGKNYKETDGLRGYEWNPKVQLSSNAMLNYQISPTVSALYKFESYKETIDIYNHTVNARLGGDQELDNSATDEQYITNRYGHYLNVNGKLANKPFSFIGSWQQQVREVEAYTYNLDYQVKTASTGRVENQSSNIYYSRGSLDHLLTNEILHVDLGFETEYQRGYDAIASGPYSDNISIQNIWYADPFLTTSFSTSERYSITPGLRFNHNSKYGTHLIWSTTMSYNLPKLFKTKLVVGSAYKTPNFSQLFYHFVDANHDVRGNPDLSPEDGISVMLDIDRNHRTRGYWKWISGIKAFHYGIKDKITQVQILDETSTGQSISRFTYLNVADYTNYGVTLENQMNYKAFDWLLGFNYIRTIEYLGEEKIRSTPFSITSRMSLDLQRLGMRLGLNVKYNGSDQQFYQTGDTIEPGKLEGYTLADASIKKSFLDNSLELTLGSRNLLNVVSINASGLSAGGGHDGVAPTSQFFSTGRSWFLKLSYSFKSKS